MAFGVKVSDFLHFKGAFERDREIELPTQKKHAGHIDVFFRDRSGLIAQLQYFLDLVRQRVQRFNHSTSFGRGEVAHSAKEEPDQRQNHQLRRE